MPRKPDLITVFFLAPLYLFLAFMVFLPLINIVLGSFGTSIFELADGGSFNVTLEGYREFLDPDSPSLESLFFTIYISAISTVISVVAGYLFAVYLTIRRPPVWQRLSTILTIPLFVPYVVGAFMWWTLLFPRGYLAMVINRLLMDLGLVSEPIPLVNDPHGIGIIFGEVWIRFVIAVMMFYGPLQMIRQDLIDAARSLGATTWQIITKIYLPLTKYAVIAASAIIMLATMSGISIPLILGGSWPQFLNVVIYLDVTTTFNYLRAYVASVFYLISSLILGYAFFRFTTKLAVAQVR